VRSVLPPTPFDLVYLLFYFEGFEVIEFGLVRLELGMEFILARFLRFITLKKNDAASLVACGKVVPSVVEFNRGDDVSFCDVLDIPFVSEAPAFVCWLLTAFIT
jgi:hypothetical protein